MIAVKQKIHNRILEKIYLHMVIDKKIPNKKKGKKRIYLFGTPQYMNYGDIAIYAAEMKFLKKYLPNYEIISIPERFVSSKIEVVESIMDDKDIIALQGGGNMGDVWQFPDMLRQDVIRVLGAKHRIILFPQSLSFNNKKWLEDMCQILKGCKNISLFARDEFSYRNMKKYFPDNVKCFLVPDMVLALDNEKNYKIKNNKKATFFLRKDKEKLKNPRLEQIKNIISNRYEIKYNDTVENVWYKIDDSTAFRRVDEKLKEFSNSSLVVTDRLHGMIFSYITNTPVLVFDNNNHKIKNFYNTWFRDIDFIFLVDDKADSEVLLKFINNTMNNAFKMNKVDTNCYLKLISELKSNV